MGHHWTQKYIHFSLSNNYILYYCTTTQNLMQNISTWNKTLTRLEFFSSFIYEKVVKHCYSQQIQILKWTLLHKIVLPTSALALSIKIPVILPLEISPSIQKFPDLLLSQESLNYLHMECCNRLTPARCKVPTKAAL